MMMMMSCSTYRVPLLTWRVIDDNVIVCRRTLYSMSSLLSSRFQCSITRSWVCRMYKRWRWTFKNTSQKHIHKYLWSNLVLYGRYLVYIRSIQQRRIKFMDESSFSSRSKFSWAATVRFGLSFVLDNDWFVFCSDISFYVF